MKFSETSDFVEKKDAGLPLQQWILLPTIGIVTIVLLAVSAEFTARLLYPVAMVGFDQCFVNDDMSGNAPVRPNGVCRERVAESRFPVEYRFNSRGNRAGFELQPKQPGTYRIVMIGSSMAMGLFVPQEKTFAALLPTELSRLTGRRVELYNEATGGKFRGGPYPAQTSVQRFKDIFSAEPDMILWVITPMDVENAAAEMPLVNSGIASSNLKRTDRPINAADDLLHYFSRVEQNLQNRWEKTRASLVLKHLLLETESQEQYVDSYLKDENDAAFLRTRPGARWLQSFGILQSNAAAFAKQAAAAGVAFVAVLVPNRAQAAMISRGEWPDGYDPYKLGNMLRSSIESDGGKYIDILPGLLPIPDPERHYFPVDGHLDADGHAMIAKLLVAKLAGSSLSTVGPAASPSAPAQNK